MKEVKLLGILCIAAIALIAMVQGITVNDSTENDFNQGIYANTTHNGTGVILGMDNLTGTYTSRVFDAGMSVFWNEINLSFSKEDIEGLYAVDVNADVWRSGNNGLNWTQTKDDYNNGDGNSVDRSLFNSTGGYYVFNGQDVWLSTDFGASWTKVNDDFNGGDGSNVVATAVYEDTLYIVDSNEDVWISSDNGASWTEIALNINAGNANIAGAVTNRSGSLFAVDVNSDVWGSNNAGVTWTLIKADYNGGDGNGATAMAIDSNNSLYIVKIQDVWKSNDNGLNWTKVNDDFNGAGDSQSSESMVVGKGDSVYIIDGGEEVFLSNNGGVTFNKISEDLNAGGGNIPAPAYYLTKSNLTFQTRACSLSDCSDGVFQGADGTDSYYANKSNELFSEGRYFQYKIYLDRKNILGMPLVSDISVEYSIEETVSACGALDTANKVYILNQSIDSTGTCINILAENITLDCQGNTINYSSSITGYGINATNANSAMIKNCIIKQVSSSVSNARGIFFKNSSNGAGVNNSVYSLNAGRAGYVESSDKISLSNNTFSASGSSSYGVYLKGSEYVTLRNNNISTSGINSEGIRAETSTNHSIFYSNIILKGSAGGYGIDIASRGANNSVVSNNISSSGEGIYLDAARNSSITGNNLSSSGTSIHLKSAQSTTIMQNTGYTSGTYAYGIYLESGANHSVVSKNTFTHPDEQGGHGIYVNSGSSFNNFTLNSINSSGALTYSWYMSSSTFNEFSENNFSSASSNFRIDGSKPEHFNNTILSNNWVNGKRMHYLFAASNQVLNENTAQDAGTLICAYCDNMQIRNLNLNGASYYGLLLYSTSNSLIENVSASDNVHGIYLEASNNNIVMNITAYSNADTNVPSSSGIYLGASNNNSIKYANSSANRNGVYLIGSSGNTIADSYAKTSLGHGIYLLYTNYTSVNNVTSLVSSLNGLGILVYTRSYNNTISNSWFSSTAGGGRSLSLDTSNFTRVENVSIMNSGYNGIHIRSSSFNQIKNLWVNRSLHDAIYFENNRSFENIFIKVNVSNTYTGYEDFKTVMSGTDGIVLEEVQLGRYNFTGSGALAKIRNGHGEISFLERINGAGINLSADITIRNNSAFVNSSQQGLNVSANITLYGIPTSIADPVILKDGAVCGDCHNFTSLDAGTVIFNATSWSNYEIGGSPDVTAPELTQMYPDQGVYEYSPIEAAVSLNEPGAGCKYSLDNWNTNTSLSRINDTLFNASVPLTDGNYEIKFACTDFGGNEGISAGFSFTVDQNAPSLNLAYPESKTYGQRENLPINFSANDAGTGIDSCWYNLNKGENITLPNCENSTFTVGADGSYSIEVFAQDGVNRTSKAERDFQISTTMAVSLLSPGNGGWTGYNDVELNYSVITLAEVSNCSLWIDSAGWHLNQTNASEVKTNGDANSFKITLGEGKYSWNVQCMGAYEATAFSEYTVNVDTTDPMISVDYPTEGTITNQNRTINLNFTISDRTADSCWYSLNGTQNKLNCSLGSNAFTFPATAGIYGLEVYANDSAGNSYTSTISNVEIREDLIAPNVQISEPRGSKTNPIPLSFNILDGVDGKNLSCWYNVTLSSVDAYVIGLGMQSFNCSAPPTHIPITLNNDAYTLYLSARDRNGNLNVTNATFNVVSSIAPENTGGGGGGSGGSRIGNGSSIIFAGITGLDIKSPGEILLNSGEGKKLILGVKNTGTNFLNGCKVAGEGEYALWIESEQVMKLGGGEASEYLISLSIPAGTSAGKYRVGFRVACEEMNKSSSIEVEVLEKKLILEILKAERYSDENLKISYSLKEASGIAQNVEMQFVLFDPSNIKVMEFSEKQNLKAYEAKNGEIIAPLNESLEGDYNLIVNVNSEAYSTFVQESVFLGKGATGFSIFSGGNETSWFIGLIVAAFLGFAGFMIYRIAKTRRVVKNHHKLIKAVKVRTVNIK